MFVSAPNHGMRMLMCEPVVCEHVCLCKCLCSISLLAACLSFFPFPSTQVTKTTFLAAVSQELILISVHNMCFWRLCRRSRLSPSLLAASPLLHSSRAQASHAHAPPLL